MPQSSYAAPCARPVLMPLWHQALNTRAELKNSIIAATPYINAGISLPPKSLTIRFSRASDVDQVVDLYSGDKKREIDPHNFVRPRRYDELAEPVKSGAAALAIDENGDIRASVLASMYEDDEPSAKNSLTEIGAVMCNASGIGLSKVVIAMMAMKQTFDPRAPNRVYAKVAQDNGSSNKVFSSSLSWDSVKCADQANTLYDLAYQEHHGQGKRDRIWYHFSDAAKQRATNILETYIQTPVLTARDGHAVAINTDSSSLWSTLHFQRMLDVAT